LNPAIAGVFTAEVKAGTVTHSEQLTVPPTPILHVYGAKNWNDEVLIVGNREGLHCLWKAVCRALYGNDGAPVMAEVVSHNDSAGYELVVLKREVTHLLALPYTGPIARDFSYDGELTKSDLLRSVHVRRSN
jgi:hypothetical protein